MVVHRLLDRERPAFAGDEGNCSSKDSRGKARMAATMFARSGFPFAETQANGQ
jgi:hypothetical protein